MGGVPWEGRQPELCRTECRHIMQLQAIVRCCASPAGTLPEAAVVKVALFASDNNEAHAIADGSGHFSCCASSAQGDAMQ